MGIAREHPRCMRWSASWLAVVCPVRATLGTLGNVAHRTLVAWPSRVESVRGQRLVIGQERRIADYEFANCTDIKLKPRCPRWCLACNTSVSSRGILPFSHNVDALDFRISFNLS